MRQRPLLSTVVPCLSLLLLSACQTLRCDQATFGDPVYLDVSYAANGMPEVVPEQCRVKQGVSVTWRGPWLDDTSFQLNFDGNPGTVTKGTASLSPSASASASVIRSSSSSSSPLSVEAAGGVPRKVRITAENPGEYEYEVRANGHLLDPHIIIER